MGIKWLTSESGLFGTLLYLALLKFVSNFVFKPSSYLLCLGVLCVPSSSLRTGSLSMCGKTFLPVRHAGKNVFNVSSVRPVLGFGKLAREHAADTLRAVR